MATPPGKGGIGVIRVSGPLAMEIGEQLTGLTLNHQGLNYAHFRDTAGELIDSGLVLSFVAPNSFTGEDVVELHGHGGPVILDMLLAAVFELGARPARAGEFSERAYLNDKIDLTQAEAIADLIDSTTQAAARGAVQSLQGAFSQRIDQLLADLIELRVYVEAAIDFPEEEIDFLADEGIRQRIANVGQRLKTTIEQAHQGAILRSGLTVVLAGAPNAGKSSLLNILAGEQKAIVTDVPGTTRDMIQQTISIDGMPLNIIDTAGLRETEDKVEQIGVQRARDAMENADHVLLVMDGTSLPETKPLIETHMTLVINKSDIIDASTVPDWAIDEVQISALAGEGIDQLKTHLKSVAGFQPRSETAFTARRRHLTALNDAKDAVARGVQQLETNNAGELLAEELRQAQESLNQITGEFSSDDLLGEIFSGFCIGK